MPALARTIAANLAENNESLGRCGVTPTENPESVYGVLGRRNTPPPLIGVLGGSSGLRVAPAELRASQSANALAADIALATAAAHAIAPITGTSTEAHAATSASSALVYAVRSVKHGSVPSSPPLLAPFPAPLPSPSPSLSPVLPPMEVGQLPSLFSMWDPAQHPLLPSPTQITGWRRASLPVGSLAFIWSP